MRDVRTFSVSESGCQRAADDAGSRIGQFDRRHFLRLATGLAAGLGTGLLALTGCSKKIEPGLRIATNQWIGYELLYLSRDLAATDPNSATSRVRLVELLSNSDSLQALTAGTVDGAGLTLDEAIAARAAGLDLKIVLVFDFSAGADVLLAKPEIGRLSELKGKRIGVEQTGVGALMLDAAMHQAGLAANQIQVVNLTADQHLEAFRNGKIDALITFEPIATQVETEGGLRLFDSRAIPAAIVDVLVVTTQALAANPGTVRTLLSGYFQALEHMRQKPADAAERMAPRLGLTPEAVQAGYAGLELPDLTENRNLLEGAPSPLEVSAAKLAALMVRQKLLMREIDVSQFIDAGPLPEVAA